MSHITPCSEICMICAIKGRTLVEICSERDREMCNRFEFLLQVKFVWYNTLFPKRFCTVCIKMLKLFSAHFNRCHYVQKVLKQWIDKNKSIIGNNGNCSCVAPNNNISLQNENSSTICSTSESSYKSCDDDVIIIDDDFEDSCQLVSAVSNNRSLNKIKKEKLDCTITKNLVKSIKLEFPEPYSNNMEQSDCDIVYENSSVSDKNNFEKLNQPEITSSKGPCKQVKVNNNQINIIPPKNNYIISSCQEQIKVIPQNESNIKMPVLAESNISNFKNGTNFEIVKKTKEIKDKKKSPEKPLISNSTINSNVSKSVIYESEGNNKSHLSIKVQIPPNNPKYLNCVPSGIASNNYTPQLSSNISQNVYITPVHLYIPGEPGIRKNNPVETVNSSSLIAHPNHLNKAISATINPAASVQGLTKKILPKDKLTSTNCQLVSQRSYNSFELSFQSVLKQQIRSLFEADHTNLKTSTINNKCTESRIQINHQEDTSNLNGCSSRNLEGLSEQVSPNNQHPSRVHKSYERPFRPTLKVELKRLLEADYTSEKKITTDECNKSPAQIIQEKDPSKLISATENNEGKSETPLVIQSVWSLMEGKNKSALTEEHSLEQLRKRNTNKRRSRRYEEDEDYICSDRFVEIIASGSSRRKRMRYPSENGILHNINSPDIYKCQLCDQVFKRKVQMECHLKMHTLSTDLVSETEDTPDLQPPRPNLEDITSAICAQVETGNTIEDDIDVCN